MSKGQKTHLNACAKRKDYNGVIDCIMKGESNLYMLMYWASRHNDGILLNIARRYGYSYERGFMDGCRRGRYDMAVQMFIRAITQGTNPYVLASRGLGIIRGRNREGHLDIWRFLKSVNQTPEYLEFYMACIDGNLRVIHYYYYWLTFNSRLKIDKCFQALNVGLILMTEIYNWPGDDEKISFHGVAILWILRYFENNYLNIEENYNFIKEYSEKSHSIIFKWLNGKQKKNNDKLDNNHLEYFGG
jgi:hypothetical protein